MKTSRTVIETKALRKIYGMNGISVLAVDGMDITISEGEFVSIMGPSGSGKSTLMNILGCLDRPTDGEYYLDGEAVSSKTREDLAKIRNQRIGFIFQSYNLLPRFSAVENVMLPMMYNRHNKIEIKNRHDLAMEALTSVGLEDRASHLPKELSGGQQQRVAIARALVNKPILIMADEPTGNLDTKSTQEIMELMLNLHQQGRTIVMITHEPEIASLTERIITIRDGKVESDELQMLQEGVLQ
ncbi:MAG: ABC transporter ATP-binding protein [Anaerolineaceae bacterium]|nr:ABC transporter ATP-binding protein [Anaerolineaceae bacterium]